MFPSLQWSIMRDCMIWISLVRCTFFFFFLIFFLDLSSIYYYHCHTKCTHLLLQLQNMVCCSRGFCFCFTTASKVLSFPLKCFVNFNKLFLLFAFRNAHWIIGLCLRRTGKYSFTHTVAISFNISQTPSTMILAQISSFYPLFKCQSTIKRFKPRF